MKKILGEIQSGKFARRWIAENKSGLKKYNSADEGRPRTTRSRRSARSCARACPGSRRNAPEAPKAARAQEVAMTASIRPSTDLRHDPARRRAVARLQHDAAGEAAGGAARWPTWAWTSSRPASRPPRAGDFEAVHAVAREVQGPTIAGLARCTRERHRDSRRARSRRRRAAASTCSSPPARSTASTSSNMAQDEIVRRAVEGVSMRARASATTWSSRPRTPRAPSSTSSAQVVEAAIDAGATTINIPDTVGYTVPDEFARAVPLPAPERARHRAACACRCTATTISAWRWRTA